MRQEGKQTVGLRATKRRSIFVAVALCCLIALLPPTASAQEEQQQQQAPATKAAAAASTKSSALARYRINLALDFEGRAYTGTELVRWTNNDDQPTSVLYFHLYPNMRAAALRGGASPATNSNAPGGDALDEPRLEVTEARSAATGTVLNYGLDDQGVTLRVNLRESVAAGATTEVLLKFKGRVPEIDSEETGLVVHVLQQVGAALRSEREMRRARDINFRSRGLMLLGSAYPVLAAREGGDWKRKVEATIGDMFFADVADYEVSINAPPEIALFTSGGERVVDSREDVSASERSARAREFEGVNMREFAIVAGRGLRSEERQVGEVKVRSVFFADHERVGQRVLANASEAVRVYVERFGAMPYKAVTVVDAPLVAGLGSAEFAGLGVIASAFYVDFDSPLMRNLPEIIREQRASVESSLEWTVAHVVAHQWWGAGVGNDPERDPVLDEALANWSALLYYTDVYTDERAALASDDQLRGVYKVYRTFGGEDMEATRPSREYRNFFQYSAIISAKGALMFQALLNLMGEEKFFAALRSYYKANLFEVAEMDDLRGAFMAEAPLTERRAVARTFNRWLSTKRGDEDIAPPDPNLAAALGLPLATQTKGGDGNAFARLGKFFWQQMTRIR